MLGLIRYGVGLEALPSAPAPAASIPLRGLDPATATLMWLAQTAAGGKSSDPLTWRCDGETLFGVYRQEWATAETIEEITFAAYRAMFAAASAAGYPHVYRIWNYLPDINREIDGLEVYKSFCIGRQKAFDLHPVPPGGVVPAACAIGTRVDGFHLCFLAGKRAALPLSNPRQIEAYHYPPRYGPRSPAFSRAVLVRQRRALKLHLSGTASIVGHATRHPGDVDAQLNETLTNLEVLLQGVGIRFPDLGADAMFTVYLRHEADLEPVRKRLSAVLPPEVVRVFLQGDICRSSLLLEIEGIIALPGTVLPDVSESLRNRKVQTRR